MGWNNNPLQNTSNKYILTCWKGFQNHGKRLFQRLDMMWCVSKAKQANRLLPYMLHQPIVFGRTKTQANPLRQLEFPDSSSVGNGPWREIILFFLSENEIKLSLICKKLTEIGQVVLKIFYLKTTKVSSKFSYYFS